MAKKTDYWKKRLALEDDETVKEIEDAVIERAAGIDEPEPADELIHITELADSIANHHDKWGKTDGLLTGLPSLDEKVGGLGKGHVILIGGETSNGKSALATNIAVNVAKSNPVLFITLEMLKEEIGSRIYHINDNTVDNLDIVFQSEHRITYADIKPLLKRAKEQAEIKMVVLDYLQYLGRGMTEREVAIISKEIKTLALEFEIPFIVIVSLRKAEKGGRNWTGIEIEDFMGTSAIGYDADVAMLASRKDLNNDYDSQHIYVKLLKTRNHALDYHDRYIKFTWNETKITEIDDWTEPVRKDLE